jgi:hypothetical protein
MDTNMNNYLTSNYVKAEDLEAGVAIEARIASVTVREFEEKDDIITKPVIRFDDGRGVVLNQTRLRAMIGGFGPNSANWLGREVIVRRGQTLYQGRSVAAVELEPIVAPRLEGGGQPAPAIEGPKPSPSGAAAEPERIAPPPRGAPGRTTIASGRKQDNGASTQGDLAARRPDLTREIEDDDIPF